MTPSEFKAWFDGFTEAFTGCPTKAQWTRIKARVAEIDGKSVTERVYVDRYWPTVWPHRTYTTCGITGLTGIGIATQGQLMANVSSGAGATYDSHKAMAWLGQNEAKALVS